MSFKPLNKSVREEILFTDDETQAEKNKVAKIQTQAVYPQKLMLLTSSLWGHYTSFTLMGQQKQNSIQNLTFYRGYDIVPLWSR